MYLSIPTSLESPLLRLDRERRSLYFLVRVPVLFCRSYSYLEDPVGRIRNPVITTLKVRYLSPTTVIPTRLSLISTRESSTTYPSTMETEVFSVSDLYRPRFGSKKGGRGSRHSLSLSPGLSPSSPPTF